MRQLAATLAAVLAASPAESRLGISSLADRDAASAGFAARTVRRDLREQRGDGRTFPVANDFIHVLDEVLAGTHANETAHGGDERRGRDLGSPSVGEFAVRDFRHDLRDLREQRGDGRTFPVANDFIHVLDEVLAGTHANETAHGGDELRRRDLGSPSVGEFAVRDFRHDLRDLREQRGDGRTFPVANDFIHVLDEVLAGTHANETAGGGDERLRRDLESPSVGAFPDQRELRIREQAKREFPYSKDFLKSPAITTTTTVPNIPLTSTVGTVTEQAIGGAAGADETTASVEKKKKKKKKGMEDADLEKQGDKKNARKMEVTDATRRRRRLGRRDNRAAIQDILKLSVGAATTTDSVEAPETETDATTTKGAEKHAAHRAEKKRLKQEARDEKIRERNGAKSAGAALEANLTLEEDHGHKYSGGKSGKAKTYEPTYFPSYFPTYQPTPPKYPTLETRDPTPRPTPQPTPQPMPQPTRRPTSNPSQAPNPVISVPVINPDFIDSYAGQRAHISVLDNDIPATGTTLHVQTIAKGTEYPTSYPTFFPTIHPTYLPTLGPTEHPTLQPTMMPTPNPNNGKLDSLSPTLSPTESPTLSPMESPTLSLSPTESPTLSPTESPTLSPTYFPSYYPTYYPTLYSQAMNYGDENGQMHNEEVAAPVGEGVSKKKRKKKALRKQVLEEAINADSAADATTAASAAKTGDRALGKKLERKNAEHRALSEDLNWKGSLRRSLGRNNGRRTSRIREEGEHITPETAISTEPLIAETREKEGFESEMGGRCAPTGNRQRVAYDPPSSDFVGKDTCTYVAQDSHGVRGTALITINVVPNPTTSIPSISPTVSPSMDTNAPTNTPPSGTIYFTSFENDVTFPEDYEQWGAFAGFPSNTAMDGHDVLQPGLWSRGKDDPRSGLFSLESPDLYDGNTDLSPAFSSVTFSTKADYPKGNFEFYVNANIEVLWDSLAYYVDGEMIREIVNTDDQYTPVIVPLSGGAHEIEIRYTFNPQGLDEESLPAPSTSGRVFIDDVFYFEEVTIPPSMMPTPTVASKSPTGSPVEPITPVPSYIPTTTQPITPSPTPPTPPPMTTYSPTTMVPSYTPTITFMPTIQGEDIYFMGDSAAVGFEAGDINSPTILAEGVITSISAGSYYSLPVIQGFVSFSGGFIPDINSYKGHLGLKRENVVEGNNTLVQVNNDRGNLLLVDKSYAGVEHGEGSGIIHSMFLDLDGNAWATGANDYGQLCLGDQVDRFEPHKVTLSGLEKVVDIAIGAQHTLLLTESGRVFACGGNPHGQLGLGEDVDQTNDPVQITGLNPVESISAGKEHSLMKTSDALYVFGSNEFGQLCTDEALGGNIYTPHPLPKDEDMVNTFTAISQSTFVLHNSGVVDACGRNDHGQLGDGTNIDSSYSSNIGASIPGMENNVVLVGKGPSSHSGFFYTDRGYMYATGLNADGQLGLGDFEDRNVPTRIDAFRQSDDVIEIGTAVSHTLSLGEHVTGTFSPTTTPLTMMPSPTVASKSPTGSPGPTFVDVCPATPSNCLPGGCDGVCSGASGTIGDGSCISEVESGETCVDLKGIVGINSCLGNQSCAMVEAEIGNASCTGSYSCEESTGNIGDASCLGEFACIGNVSPIKNFSCRGSGACFQNSQVVGNNSCIGPSSCKMNSGSIGDNSCSSFGPSDDGSCAVNSGPIGSGSCNGFGACFNNTGTIGDNACNGYMACANNDKTIADNACEGRMACHDNMADISIGACIGEEACANNTAPIGHASCFGWLSCYGNGGKIGTLVMNQTDVTDLPSGSCVGTIRNKTEALLMNKAEEFLGVCYHNKEEIGEGSCKNSVGGGEEMCSSNHGMIAGNACLDSGACKMNEGNVAAGACQGIESCTSNTANIGTDSCGGNQSCKSNTGPIGDDSCNNGRLSCNGNKGTIGNGSCQDSFACQENLNTIGGGSCNNSFACCGNTESIAPETCNLERECSKCDA